MRLRAGPLAAIALLITAVLLLGGAAVAAPQFVGLSCTYVEAGPPGPAGNVLEIDGSQAEEDSFSLRRSGDQIEVVDLQIPGALDFFTTLTNEGEPLPCTGGTPTVTNLDRIRYRTTLKVGPSAQIDLRGGALGPGATGSGITVSFERMSSILVAATRGADTIRAGRLGPKIAVDLGGTGEGPGTELLMPPRLESLAILGLDGPDSISASGGPGFDGPLRGHLDVGVVLNGGNANDALTGSPVTDALEGGRGDDVLRGLGGSDALALGFGRDRAFGGDRADFLFAKDGRRDIVGCGPGFDLAKTDHRDRSSGCEGRFTGPIGG